MVPSIIDIWIFVWLDDLVMVGKKGRTRGKWEKIMHPPHELKWIENRNNMRRSGGEGGCGGTIYCETWFNPR